MSPWEGLARTPRYEGPSIFDFLLSTQSLWQTTGAQAIIDAVFSNTPIFIPTSQPSNGRLAGSLALNNIPIAVGVTGGAVVLDGGTTAIVSWGQGNVPN
jgi:hypothetical protein